MRKRLTKAARCAIKMRSAMPDRKHATELLRADLRNSPLHCFGVHSKCSTDYCTVAQAATTDSHTTGTTTKDGDASDTSPEVLPSTIASQEAQQWIDALDEENMEAIRSNTTPAPATLDPELIWDIQQLVGRLIAKADQLSSPTVM